MKIIEWNTPCSRTKDLAWVSTLDKGPSLHVTFGGDSAEYEFVFKNIAAYQVYDEAYLIYKHNHIDSWTLAAYVALSRSLRLHSPQQLLLLQKQLLSRQKQLLLLQKQLLLW